MLFEYSIFNRFSMLQFYTLISYLFCCSCRLIIYWIPVFNVAILYVDFLLVLLLLSSYNILDNKNTHWFLILTIRQILMKKCIGWTCHLYFTGHKANSRCGPIAFWKKCVVHFYASIHFYSKNTHPVNRFPWTCRIQYQAVAKEQLHFPFHHRSLFLGCDFLPLAQV